MQILLHDSKDYRKSFPILQTITNPFRFYRLLQVLPDASRFGKLSQFLPDSANYCKSRHDSEEDYWRSFLILYQCLNSAMILLLKGNKEILDQERNSRTGSIVPMDLFSFFARILLLRHLCYRSSIRTTSRSPAAYTKHTHTYHTRKHQKQPTVQFVSPPGSLATPGGRRCQAPASNAPTYVTGR